MERGGGEGSLGGKHTFEHVRRFRVWDRLSDRKVGVDLLKVGLAREVAQGRVHDLDELRQCGAVTSSPFRSCWPLKRNEPRRSSSAFVSGDPLWMRR